ncbi:MAG: hypothetical protein WDW38_001504 [Sanguina aurantia]
MRHGHRQDEEQRSWHEFAEHPWNPPLSALGRKQARAAGEKMKALGIEYIITSPFLRCLQTSSEIVSAMGLTHGQWLLDWSMAEMCEPRLLFAGRPELLHSIADRPIIEWMWDGMDTKAAVESFLKTEKPISGVTISPVLWNLTTPVFPETMPTALLRYQGQILTFMRDFEGRKVLVVSHGEAVRAAVNHIQEDSLVYEVDHTGYAPLLRQKSAGEWQRWKLDAASGQTGVSWYD